MLHAITYLFYFNTDSDSVFDLVLSSSSEGFGLNTPFRPCNISMKTSTKRPVGNLDISSALKDVHTLQLKQNIY